MRRSGPAMALAAALPAVAEGPGRKREPVKMPKKGVGHWGSRLPEAPDLLGCGWYYNWGPAPGAPVKNGGAEFVPMIWSGKSATDGNLAAVRSGSCKALLGFNEPDGHGQADMTVDEAIALWPELMATGLRLGSPGTTTGAPWLDEFMKKAKAGGLRVDFLCLHRYGDITKPEPVGDLKRHPEGYWKRYGLPIRLTEYSGADFDYHLRKTTVEDNAEFAAGSVAMMEALPFVERYAWFAPLVSSRDRHYPTVAMMDRHGVLTPVGLAWTGARQPGTLPFPFLPLGGAAPSPRPVPDRDSRGPVI